jgi:hypothetical protein
VGSGSAVPVTFRKSLGSGTLLLASDGLLKYAGRNDTATIARSDDLDATVQELTGLTVYAPATFPTT